MLGSCPEAISRISIPDKNKAALRKRPILRCGHESSTLLPPAIRGPFRKPRHQQILGKLVALQHP